MRRAAVRLLVAAHAVAVYELRILRGAAPPAPGVAALAEAVERLAHGVTAAALRGLPGDRLERLAYHLAAGALEGDERAVDALEALSRGAVDLLVVLPTPSPRRARLLAELGL